MSQNTKNPTQNISKFDFREKSPLPPVAPPLENSLGKHNFILLAIINS